MSARAKAAEDAVAAAEKEAHDKVMARREQAHAAATAAIEKVNRDMKSVGDSATGAWNALKAKVAADVNTMKAGVARRKHDVDVKLAENEAESLEQEAAFTIDYAIASVEQAKLAVLDAIVGRVQAEAIKKS